jgi:hypothetical protein
MSLKDALALKNVEVECNGTKIQLRRPSLADLADVYVKSKEDGVNFTAWLVYNHLLEDNKQFFNSLEEVLKCDGLMIEKIAMEIDKLYSEGSKSQDQQ